MKPPQDDLDDRRPVYDALQMFWMDTDPALYFDAIVAVCAQSKYSVADLEEIFWNEVEPAVGFNLWSIAGEWRGFDLDDMTARILQKRRRAGARPLQFLRPNARDAFRRLAEAVDRARAEK